MTLLVFAVGVTLIIVGFRLMCSSEDVEYLWIKYRQWEDIFGVLSKIVFVIGLLIFITGWIVSFYGYVYGANYVVDNFIIFKIFK
jgi:hypothetical protein